MKQFFLSILLMLLPVVAWADAVEIDGIWYNLITKGKLAVVIKNPSDGQWNGSYYGAVTIPPSVEYGGTTYSVTSIGERAFNWCTGLTSVTIPEGVTSIGDNAFEGCSGLTSVTIPEGVTSIGNGAFSNCSGLTSVTIPEGVTSIGSYAFNGCSSLTSVTIPASVTSIGSSAFSGCYGLTSVTIPEGVTSIGYGAFSGCSGLTSVNIPEGVTSIGGSAFSGCSGLTSVTFPEGVTYIGSSAFSGCSGLTTVTIPYGVTSIDNQAFYGCSSLTSITVPSSVRYINYQAFANCSNLEDVYCYPENLGYDEYYGGLETSSNVFDNSYIDYAALHVPAEAIESYRNTAPWSGFGNIVALTDGDASYRMTVTTAGKGSVAYGRATVSGGSQLFYVKASEGAVLTLTADEGYQIGSVTVNGEDVTSGVEEGQLTISEPTADLTVSVTFAYAGETASLTVGSVGMATYCSTDALDFSEVKDIRAYVASGFDPADGKLLLMHINKVPAGTGLLIKGTAGTYSIPVKPTTFYYLNLLKPVFEAMTVPETESDGSVNYVLANGEDGLLFYRSDNAKLSANRAYLQLPAAAAGARQFIEWEEAGEATAISSVRSSGQQAGVYYNLQGQRVAHPSKGLYIKDGKKVLIK